MLWMMNNQLSRRNLNDFQRVEMVKKCEGAVKAQAEERQKGTRFGGGGKIATTVEKSRDTLGALAGVSGKTYEHATALLDNAPEEVIQAVSLHYSRMYRISGRVLNGLIPGQKTALNRNASTSFRGGVKLVPPRAVHRQQRTNSVLNSPVGERL